MKNDTMGNLKNTSPDKQLRSIIAQFDVITRKPFAIYVILAVIVILGFFIPFIALAASLVFSYKIMTRVLSKKLFDSNFFVFAVSIFFYMLILQGIVLISWLFSHNFPLSVCGPLTLPILIVLSRLAPKIQKKKLSSIVRKREKYFAVDVVPVIVCIVAFLLVVVLPIVHSGSTGPSSAIVLINRVIDDPNHLGLLNDRLNFDRGIILNSDAESHTESEGVSFYPAGWHSANAVIIKAFYPHISTGAESLIAYAITKVFWFLFLVYIFVRTILGLYRFYSKEIPSLAIQIWITLASLLFTLWFLIDPFMDGFYSFIPQLIIVPLFVLSLIQLSTLRKGDSQNFLAALIVPAALCMGSAVTWMLLFPVFALTLLLCMFNVLHDWGIKKSLKDLVSNIPQYLLFYLLIITPVVVQLMTSGGTGGSVSLIQGLLLPGPIQTYPTTFYDFIFVGLALFIVFTIKTVKQNALKPILFYLLVIAGFCAALYILQIYKEQTALYYYFKSLSTFTIMAIILFIVGSSFALQWIESKTSRLFTILISIIIILLSVQFVFTKPLLLTYISGGRATSAVTNKEIFNMLTNRYSQKNYNNKEVVIFYPDNNPNLNEVAARLLSSNKPFTTCYSELKRASFSTKPALFSVQPILKFCSDANIKITYYVDADSAQNVGEIINAAHLNDRVVVKLIQP
jgi:hypothetical protein